MTSYLLGPFSRQMMHKLRKRGDLPAHTWIRFDKIRDLTCNVTQLAMSRRQSDWPEGQWVALGLLTQDLEIRPADVQDIQEMMENKPWPNPAARVKRVYTAIASLQVSLHG